MLSWDRSHDWVVQRCYHELTRLTVRFACETPTAFELLALRRCLPQFRHTPPAALRASIGSGGSLPLGEIPTREARRLVEVAKAACLDIVAENASYISYLPYDRTTGCAWLIEDDDEARFVAEAMIAAGVPINEAFA